MKEAVTFLKNRQEAAERYVFPVLLFLWPFVTLFQGVELTDTTYALANYQAMDYLDSTWTFATYFANCLGKHFLSLPGGGTMAGVKAYATLVISLTALVVYFGLRRFMPGWMLFVGEVLAVSAAWCPAVILYNNLTYLFMTAACLLLFLGISSVPERNIWFVLAGIVLGLNVFVRFSNLAEVALIVPVWFHAVITMQKSTKLLPRTASCVGGYVLGVLAGLLLLTVIGNVGDYLQMIPALFSMTSGAKDYTAAGMLWAILAAYLHSARFALLFVAAAAAGMLFFSLPAVRKTGWAGRGLFLAGLLVLLRFLYGRGMYTLNYRDYWAMFEWGMLFLILCIVLFLIGMSTFLFGGAEERFLAALCLMVVLITPLGSNNYTFPALNNLYLPAPVALWLFRRLAVRMGKREIHFAWKATVLCILLAFLVQAGLFHMQFAFRDGTDGTARTQTVRIEKLKGMKTTPQNAESLNRLADAGVLSFCGRSTVAFGNIPGIHYLFNLNPALSTLWPDLDSYPVSKMEKDLAALTEEPLVILKNAEPAGEAGERKQALLSSYMEEHAYETIYEDADYRILLPAGTNLRLTTRN